ncbi:MAG TPA: Crp/Fnr family transcriptional regulator [Sphingomicrobium sp.]|nr:Crp/Fnr family transcriptional regulator [Sphingomicrobium sp.]
MKNPLLTKLENIVDLADDDMAAIDGMCTETHDVPDRTDIIRDGERPEHVHLILDGWAFRYKLLEDGKRQITAFLIPGDFCDMHVAILGAMDHNIGTLTPTRVAYIPHSAIEALLERPRVARGFWWATLVDEAVLRAWLVNIGQRDAFRRISHLICEMHLRMEQVGLTDGNSFDLPLTQDELADAMGLTSVHVNRVLKRLNDEGLIVSKRSHMTITDVERLRQVSDFDAKYLHLEDSSSAA